MNWGKYDLQMQRLSDTQRREALRFAERLVEQAGMSPDDAVWAALVRMTPKEERDLLVMKRLQNGFGEDLYVPRSRPRPWDD